MRCYHRAWRIAREYAADQDFDVLFGLEHHYGHGKEVLTYGIDLEFLLANPGLDQLTLREYSNLVHKEGGFLSMAHPFRRAPYIDPEVSPRPDCLDGAELFNFFNTGEENQEAATFISKHGLLPTSGGDVHSITEPAIGMAGIAVKQRIHTGRQLVEVLKSGDYRLIVNGELV